jgi:hypothetical protein
MDPKQRLNLPRNHVPRVLDGKLEAAIAAGILTDAEAAAVAALFYRTLVIHVAPDNIEAVARLMCRAQA